MTTTLISLKTPKPLATTPAMLRITENTTIVASKELKNSARYAPDEANDFRQISTKKNTRKHESMFVIIA